MTKPIICPLTGNPYTLQDLINAHDQWQANLQIKSIKEKLSEEQASQVYANLDEISNICKYLQKNFRNLNIYSINEKISEALEIFKENTKIFRETGIID